MKYKDEFLRAAMWLENSGPDNSMPLAGTHVDLWQDYYPVGSGSHSFQETVLQMLFLHWIAKEELK